MVAVHHRATGCPDDKPRKLIRTTVNNDFSPTDAEVNVTEGLYDLSLDRIHAVLDQITPTSDEL